MPHTPPQELRPPGPPLVSPGARRRPSRPRAFYESPSNSASPSFPSTSCSSTSPSTPSLPRRQQPVALQFPGASESEEDEGENESTLERGSRGDERRGGRDPEGGEGGDEGGRT